jgi:hypothetical protein
MNLTLEERETNINMTADDRSQWTISSDDPVMQRRIEAVGATLLRVGRDGTTKFYTLPANQVSFRRPQNLTVEQREGLAERMRAARAAQVIT